MEDFTPVVSEMDLTRILEEVFIPMASTETSDPGRRHRTGQIFMGEITIEFMEAVKGCEKTIQLTQADGQRKALKS